jgi:DNA-directed RNA polymerase II subunit RPB2
MVWYRRGEMERDVMISLGSSGLIQERLNELSDKYFTYVCEICGLLCIGNPEKKIWICKSCKSTKVALISIPYASKLLVNLLYSVGIGARIRVE